MGRGKKEGKKTKKWKRKGWGENVGEKINFQKVGLTW